MDGISKKGTRPSGPIEKRGGEKHWYIVINLSYIGLTLPSGRELKSDFDSSGGAFCECLPD